MSTPDCPNCLYPTSPAKKETSVPQGLYNTDEVDKDLVEDCPQCFYQPEGGEKPAEATDDCAQCFYQPKKD